MRFQVYTLDSSLTLSLSRSFEVFWIFSWCKPSGPSGALFLHWNEPPEAAAAQVPPCALFLSTFVVQKPCTWKTKRWHCDTSHNKVKLMLMPGWLISSYILTSWFLIQFCNTYYCITCWILPRHHFFGIRARLLWPPQNTVQIISKLKSDSICSLFLIHYSLPKTICNSLQSQDLWLHRRCHALRFGLWKNLLHWSIEGKKIGIWQIR